MMTVLVTYNVTVSVEMPEKEVKKIFKNKDILKQGHKFNLLAQEDNEELEDVLSFFDDVEISGVYNPIIEVDDNTFKFLNENYPEVIWEA